MFSLAEYELLDFGEGRKLERFGDVILDRPAPAASDVRRSQPDLWSQATARYELVGDQRGGERGKWVPADALPERWTIAFGPLRFELKPTDFGHVGVFPEQIANWEWIARQVRAAAAEIPRLRVLNLFAHTGGSTLAAAAAGAEVVHVDSARNVVAWARRNAELTDLASAPIRWIVEDAALFVRRELKRGNRYDAVILDPPSFGHGPAGETWKLEDDLPALLAACADLTAGRCRFILLTCHTPSVTPTAARDLLGAALTTAAQENGHDGSTSVDQVSAGELSIECALGRRMSCGVFARCPGA
ncbi:MAG TPA: class I SAM-dependent methyltransferase [Pirellulales bacterium]|jgi:23S rRNA (cytosine1962-C5)-methyltransferase|nr:class I SAM-dependent methyltransferase [Pirellulales bacterium]